MRVIERTASTVLLGLRTKCGPTSVNDWPARNVSVTQRPCFVTVCRSTSPDFTTATTMPGCECQPEYCSGAYVRSKVVTVVGVPTVSATRSCATTSSGRSLSSSTPEDRSLGVGGGDEGGVALAEET